MEFHRPSRTFCATISEMSFGEAMGATIYGAQLPKFLDWWSKVCRNSQRAMPNPAQDAVGQALFKDPYCIIS